MRPLRVATAAAALAAAPWLVPSPVSAHEEGAVLLTAVVESVTPPVPGLSVSVLTSVAPLLEVRNGTGVHMVVLGEAGEPFLRIGPGGVQGNVRSSTLARSTDPFAPEEGTFSPGATPRWRSLGPEPVWRWFDPRLNLEPDAAARAPFRVPLLVGGRPVEVRGFVQAGEVGHLRSVLDRTPPVPGVEVRLLEGQIPAIFVRNDTGLVLEVPGFEGEPFLRIGPGGVRGNRRSPSFYRAGSQTVRPIPPGLRPASTPIWIRLSTQPAWAWLEYRARVPDESVRPFVLGDRTATVAHWTTPLRLGGRVVSIAGHVEWVPSRRSPGRLRGRLPGWPIAGVTGIGALLVGRSLRWRRKEKPPVRTALGPRSR